MTRIATTPAAWSNDDDTTLGEGTTLDTCLTEAAEIGFNGIEMGHKFPTDPAELKTTLDTHSLSLAAAHHGLHLLERSAEDERAAIQPVIDMMKAVGCTTLIVKEVSNATFTDDKKPISAKPSLASEDWDSFALKLDQVATFCADQGIDCVYHHYMGTIVQTPEEVDRLMMETEAVHLLFDTAQCYVGGGDPAQMLTRHLQRVKHFHAGNVRVRELTKARMNDMSVPAAVRSGIFTVPGDRDGSVDFKTCVNLLSGTGYEGWLVVTAGQDPEARKPSEYQGMGYRAIHELTDRTGLAA